MYLTVGAAAMLARSLGDVVGSLGTRLLGSTWVVEATSTVSGTWQPLGPGGSLDEVTERLAGLARHHAGCSLFDTRHWRLRNLSTGEVVPGEVLGDTDRDPGRP
jgi:hypothetical protein